MTSAIVSRAGAKAHGAFAEQIETLLGEVDIPKYLAYPDTGMGLLSNVICANPLTSAEKEIWEFAKRVSVEAKFGYVYILKGTHDKVLRHKIGKANDLKDRIRTFSVKLLFDIEILASFYVNSPIRFESALHAQMKQKRIAGEWFDLNENDIYNLCAVGMAQESSDMADCLTQELNRMNKASAMPDAEYIEYLESVLVMNQIKFEGR